MRKPFIMVAPNGARRGKADHPDLPVTLAEIVAAARECHKAGAHGLHLHVRDADGQHSLDAGLYREAVDELERVVPDLRVQITTEAAGRYAVAEQLQCLSTVKPGWASISVREIAREPDLAEKVYGACYDAGTEVQHILYDVSDLELLQGWRARGIVRPEQGSVLCVLGRYTPALDGQPEEIGAFRDTGLMPDQWMVCAFGSREHACLHAAADQGADLRVGFENSLQDAGGQPYESNAHSVARLVESLERTRG